MNAIGPVVGGMAANSASKYTKKQMFANAQSAQADGVMEREKVRLASRIAEGRQLVDQAGSGFQLAEGTATDALRETATAREMDILTSRFNADSKARGFRQEGNLARAQGKSALVGGIISGAATLANDAAAAFGGGGGLSASNIGSFVGGGG